MRRKIRRPTAARALIVRRVASITESNLSSTGGAPLVFTVTVQYDSQDRLVSSTDSAGNTTSCAYDSLGRVVRVTDPNGNDTTYAYDFMGDCLASVSYAGSSSAQSPVIVRSSSATYDSSLRCATSTDANGNTTQFGYDSLGRCTSITNADGTQLKLIWSPRSNLVGRVDPNGNVFTNVYDLNDRLIRRDITMPAAGGGGAGGALYVELFTHDGCDRLIGYRDDDSDGDFTYDSLGNCLRERLNGLATSSTYDALGNRLSLAYPGGRSLTYAYDTSSRCTSITESGALLASFDYTGLDRVSRVTYGNGMRTQIGYDGLVGTPNAQDDHGFGQVSRIRHAMTAGSPIVSDCKFTYDLKQNKTARTVAIPGQGGRTNVMMLDYDGVDQLVQSAVLDGTTLLRNTTYGLDHMGNRTNVSGAASCSGDYLLDWLVPGPQDFQMNQYTATPCDTRTYDDNGNLLSRSSPISGPVSYQYDYANRLVQAQSVDFSNGTVVITTSTYAYDALGRRFSKTVSSGTLPPNVRQYCYDGTCAIEERAGGAVIQSFVHATGLTDKIRENDTVVFEMRQGTQDYYFHTDDQGNTLALTGANGAVVERYDYDDYGAVTFLTSDGLPSGAASSVVGNPYCWGGLRLDPETGLQNNDGGGYFDPQSGRDTGGKGAIYYIKDAYQIRTIRSGGSGFSDNNPWSGGGPVAMKNGTVKFFNEAKGFGFIKEEGGQEIAKHYITIPHNFR